MAPYLVRVRVWLHRRRLAVFSRHMLGSPKLGDDVAREVSAGAVAGLRGAKDPRPRLYRLARERCLTRPAPEPVPSPALVADVVALPEPQRAALLMREVAGLSRTQIAEAMEVSEETVRSLLVRARIAIAEDRADDGTRAAARAQPGAGPGSGAGCSEVS